MMTVRFEDLRVLDSAERVADDYWKIVMAWGNVARDTVGKQSIKAVDSIGANIAEAYGRYHYDEKLQFYYYARGSLFESKFWLNRGQSRGLINPQQFQQLSKALSGLAHQINALAKSTKEQKKKGKSPNRIAEHGPHYITAQLSSDIDSLNEEFNLFSQEEIEYLEAPPSSSITQLPNYPITD